MLLAPATTAARRSARRAGFTLLEVLVVVAILVILAGVGVVATTKYLEDARKKQAQLQCKSLVQACETYYLDAQSGHQYPETLQQLIQPFGGTGGTGSLLKNGQNDLIDPWGQPYQYQVITHADGNVGPEVFTQSRDGVRINQKGVGQLAQQ